MVLSNNIKVFELPFKIDTVSQLFQIEVRLPRLIPPLVVLSSKLPCASVWQALIQLEQLKSELQRQAERLQKELAAQQEKRASEREAMQTEFSAEREGARAKVPWPLRRPRLGRRARGDVRVVPGLQFSTELCILKSCKESHFAYNLEFMKCFYFPCVSP